MSRLELKKAGFNAILIYMGILNKIRRKYNYWKFRIVANRRYRVVEREKDRYTIQVRYNKLWSPVIVDELSDYSSTIDDYRRVCDEFRNSYYEMLVDNYEKELDKHKYPIVVY